MSAKVTKSIMTQSSQIPYAFFRDTLCRCGMFFDESNSYAICVDAPRSIRQLESTLRLHSTRLNEFVASMGVFLDDMVCLKAAMEPIRASATSAPHRGGSMYGQTDTLLRMLLRIQSIQTALVHILMDKMIEVALQRSSGDPEDEAQTELADTDTSMQILNHIRWCDVIFDSTSLIHLFLDNVQVPHTHRRPAPP